MDLKLPFRVLEWVDANRGRMSRQAFIVQCLVKLMEIHEIKDQPKQ